ncbi:MAG: DNA mismatch repair protein MutS [Crocinitomicaceae bacterium]|nr:DNA mismatch repair protein MutS [Crocinitomicaceae bacterium]
MNIEEVYLSKKEQFGKKLSQVKQSLVLLSTLRLGVFILTGFSIYFFWGQTAMVVTSSVLGFGVFGFLIARYAGLVNRKRYFEALKKVNQTEINALDKNYEGISDGAEFLQSDHYFNQDIDLYGPGTIFQVINRTETVRGEQLLSSWMNSNNISSIVSRQEGIKEIGEKIDWRQHYKATAGQIKDELDTRVILKWLTEYRRFIPAIFRFIPAAFSIASVIMITLYAIEFIPGMYLVYWLFLGLGITGPYFKRIHKTYINVSQVQDTFVNYSKLLTSIETETFTSKILRDQQAKIVEDGHKASAILNRLAKDISNLSNRNNMMMMPILNGYFLWDLHFTYRIETWISEFNTTAKRWFETIEYFDAISSFGNYAYNHPNHIYANILESEGKTLIAKGMAHPLLDTQKCVTNDVTINTEDFIIITGANMAGKSTFLRTVALNIVLTNCGLPVPSKTFDYKPIKLISSMRTSDSLLDDESYFFSELKRLKFIVEEIKKDTYFIILDEILKGTNSKDKAEGSAKFVEKLVASSSTGLIATHDLSLCILENKLPTVRNHYFDAEIINNELFFDYRFKDGVCQNMNASFLLKKMGIVD